MVKGVGECQFRRLEKKLSTLSTLCTNPTLLVPLVGACAQQVVHCGGLIAQARKDNRVEHCQILEWKKELLIQVNYMVFIIKQSYAKMLIT